ncbi:MAG: hypothetical protein PHN35_07120 [Clostridia bacterium]|nr:hypothetical protein [Clostridia bacterium]
MRADLKKRLAAIRIVEPDEIDIAMIERAKKDKGKPVPFTDFLKEIRALEKKERQQKRLLKKKKLKLKILKKTR